MRTSTFLALAIRRAIPIVIGGAILIALLSVLLDNIGLGVQPLVQNVPAAAAPILAPTQVPPTQAPPTQVPPTQAPAAQVVASDLFGTTSQGQPMTLTLDPGSGVLWSSDPLTLDISGVIIDSNNPSVGGIVNHSSNQVVVTFNTSWNSGSNRYNIYASQFNGALTYETIQSHQPTDWEIRNDRYMIVTTDVVTVNRLDVKGGVLP